MILIIGTDKGFKTFPEFEDYCGINFASLTSWEVKYLFTYLLVTWVFSPKIYLLIICMGVCVLRVISLTMHLKSFLVCKDCEVKINYFKIPLTWQFPLPLHALTDIFLLCFDVEMSPVGERHHFAYVDFDKVLRCWGQALKISNFLYKLFVYFFNVSSVLSGYFPIDLLINFSNYLSIYLEFHAAAQKKRVFWVDRHVSVHSYFFATFSNISCSYTRNS